MFRTPASDNIETTLTVVVEPVGFGDLGAVAAIQRESFRPGLAYSRVALMLLWALPVATFLVARDPATGDVVGNVITDRVRDNTRIVNIAVARDARRRGIARQMLWAIDQRCPEGDIVLAVEESNVAAQRLYEREGYIRTSVNRDYYGVNNHGYTMKKVRRNRPASVTSP
jgi:ribosomal protein S18 acetylase RimI-like enzyme